TIEGCEQGLDFALSPVPLFGDQQRICCVALAEHEIVDAMLCFPVSETAPQIALDAARRLVALLSRLSEQLHYDCGDGSRNMLGSLARRQRPSCDMAVHPLHWIRRGKRQVAREHLIERNAESIEITTGIDRPVHTAGLFRSHVRQRSGDHLGRLGYLMLARQPRGDAEAREPGGTALDIH